MTEVKENDKHQDEAGEKMLDNELKPLAETSTSVPILIPDKQNGEANIDSGKTIFVGMGKEELMKYANDPFWVRLRWCLFILFWLLWIAMLVGSIVIIVTAPKCAAPESRKWWESELIVKVDDSRELDFDPAELARNKLKTVIVRSVLDAYKSPNHSDLKDVLKVVKNAQEQNLTVIIGLNPIASDEFRVKSENADKSNYEEFKSYKDYYIWQNGINSENEVPNNWISYKRNSSAWQYNVERQQFIYQPGEFPTLNFRHPEVSKEFVKIIGEWLDLGIGGFELSEVPYMFVNEDMESEVASNKPGTIHTDYTFWRHTKTKNLKEIGNVLLEWREAVKSRKEDAVFMLADDLDTLDPFIVNETLTIDLPKHSTVFTLRERLTTAKHIYDGIHAAFSIIDKYWPVWEYTTTDTLDDSVMKTVTTLLPGTVIMNHNVTNIKLINKLQEYRTYDSFLNGTFSFHLLEDESLFAYKREKPGSVGLLVVCNPTTRYIPTNFTSLIEDKQKLSLAFTNNLNETKEELESLKINSNVYNITAATAMVFTY